MRLDKFLTVSRVIKRRTVAKDSAGHGRIVINEKGAKSSRSGRVGDVLTIKFGNKTSKIKVLELKETTKKNEAAGMYELVSEEYKEDYRL